MNYQDAVARQRSLRDGQTARCRLTLGSEPDREQLTAVAVEDGVPARYASMERGQLGHSTKALTAAISHLTAEEPEMDGLIIFGESAHGAPSAAGALYKSALVRGRAARWVNMPELADHLTRKIQLDQQREWDVGQVVDWNTELDSIKYCYDLVVFNRMARQLLSAYIATELFKILASRADRGLFTVIVASKSDITSLWDESPSIAELIEQQYNQTVAP